MPRIFHPVAIAPVYGGWRRSSSMVWLSCIMPTMFSRRSSFARLSAAILPVILLWSFVACLSICSDPCVQTGNDSAELASPALNIPEDEESCPIPAASFLISRRASIAVPQMNTGMQTLARSIGVASQPLNNAHDSIPSLWNMPSLTDPPLARLRSLRI